MKIIKTILVILFLLALSDLTMAQRQRTMSFDANTSLLLQELNAMLVQNEDGIQVEMILGGHNQPASANSDDLQRGDFILMMNGERISDVPGMRAIYEAIPNDEEIKIGVRRDNQRFIVSAIKGDIPESQGVRMTMTVDSDDGSPPVIVAELGMILSLIEGQIQIQTLLEPLLPGELKNEDLEGFEIITINGESFDAAADVQAFISALEVGDQIDLVVEKDGDQKVFTFERQEARGAVNMSVDG
jgi:PDZ domain-containing secreted protein